MSDGLTDVQEIPDELMEVAPQLGLVPAAIWACPKCNGAAQSVDRRLVEKLKRPGDFAMLTCRCGARLKLKIPLIHHAKFQPQIVRSK